MKLYMRVKAVVLLPFFSAMTCVGQELNVGDMVPDIELNNVFNYAKDNLKLSDLRGKLVILDFWGFKCISCLQAFPKMDSLQKIFGDKIQVIFVNRESKDSTKRFFEQKKRVLLPPMPFITKDTILHKLFRPGGLPYYVWIDSSGVVRYFPEPTSITPARIRKFLSGEDITIQSSPKKRRYVRSFITNEWKRSLDYYSYISRCVYDVNLEASERIAGYMQISSSCLSVIELYQLAFGSNVKKYPGIYTEYGLDRPGRVILEASDSYKYLRPKSSDENYDLWTNNYSYNYHLFWPESKKDQFYQIMRDDLDKFFGLKGKIEKRKMKCFVLVRTSLADKLKTKGDKTEDSFFKGDILDTVIRSVRLMKNISFEKFSSRLETIVEQSFSQPYLDETGYKGNIDFKIDGKLLDNITLDVLRRELRNYDLDLVEKERSIEALVIRQQDKKQ